MLQFGSLCRNYIGIYFLSGTEFSHSRRYTWPIFSAFRNQNLRLIFLSVALLSMLWIAVPVQAGNLDSPAAPDSAGSAMYSLSDIYDRLRLGAAGSKRSGAFREPVTGPASTGYTLDDIMDQAPYIDNVNGAIPEQVVANKSYWGMRDGYWGPLTGTAVNGGNIAGVDGSRSIVIPDGFYSAGKTATVNDVDLLSANIRSGVNLFGVTGDGFVVDTRSGNATAAEIQSGRIAWVNGVEVTGSANCSTNTLPAPVPRTGQAKCYDPALNTEISCAGTGQDGDYQAGIPWPVPRFVDNSNGTVRDQLTGLVWLKNASCMTFYVDDLAGSNTRLWRDALLSANSLSNGYCGLSDNSVAGDWRLPNVRELYSLFDLGRVNPGLSNAAGTGSWSEGDAFSSVPTNYFWSSTSRENSPGRADFAWMVSSSPNYVTSGNKSTAYAVWPVRDGL